MLQPPTAFAVSPGGAPATVDAPDIASPAGRVLLVIADETQLASWQAAIIEERHPNLTVLLQIGVPPRRDTDSAFDAILVDVAAGGGEGLGRGVSLLGRVRDAEVVFFCENGGAPEVAALRALQWPNLVVGRRARRWIIDALPTLARVGQARRRLRRAQAEVPPPPDGGDETSLSLPLGIAESRFREAYVRAMLAREGGRTTAAKKAHVPYRTFCKIIRKLGIDIATR
jgi:hypothetical protein